MVGIKNSYRDNWQSWGIATALHNLLIMEKETYTAADIMLLAEFYGVDDDVIRRLSYDLK